MYIYIKGNRYKEKNKEIIQIMTICIFIEGYTLLDNHYECPQFQLYLQNANNGVHTILYFKKKLSLS